MERGGTALRAFVTRFLKTGNDLFWPVWKLLMARFWHNLTVCNIPTNDLRQKHAGYVLACLPYDVEVPTVKKIPPRWGGMSPEFIVYEKLWSWALPWKHDMTLTATKEIGRAHACFNVIFTSWQLFCSACIFSWKKSFARVSDACC